MVSRARCRQHHVFLGLTTEQFPVMPLTQSFQGADCLYSRHAPGLNLSPAAPQQGLA